MRARGARVTSKAELSSAGSIPGPAPDRMSAMSAPSDPADLPARPRRAAHDVGGLPAGPIDRAEHEPNFWEWRVDALVRLLFEAGVLGDFAELRRAIEDLGPDVYERLSYYERWAAASAALCVEKGVVTQAELDARVARVRERFEGAS